MFVYTGAAVVFVGVECLLVVKCLVYFLPSRVSVDIAGRNLFQFAGRDIDHGASDV